MKKTDTKCLVVDHSYFPRSVISTERAFVIVYKGNAEVVANHDTYFGTVSKTIAYPKPSIIRIFKNIKLEYTKVPLTRKNIYKRDSYSCVYCGSNDKSSLTLDHVIPRAKGGRDTWHNLVTSCSRCNSEKADLDIEEWGRPHPNPKRPHYLMLMKTLEHVPDEWKLYLFY